MKRRRKKMATKNRYDPVIEQRDQVILHKDEENQPNILKFK